MKVANNLPLLLGIEILVALLCGAQDSELATTSNNMTDAPPYRRSQDRPLTPFPENSPAMNHDLTVSPSQKTVSTSLRPKPTTPTPSSLFDQTECAPALMVAGCLIIACIILLFSTLYLTCKVCQLSRRIKKLGDNSDLIINWPRTTKRKTSKTETEANHETNVLMTDISQTREDLGDSTTKEDEEEKENNHGQEGEEEKKRKDEEAGETANGVEASVVAGDKKETVVIVNSSPPKLQEGTKSSSCSKATEEPKDGN
ncbi:uncharacterized protein ACBR49_010432 [Aulostomus maculatus]